MPHEFLTAQEVNERFPAWNLPDEFEANFDPQGGVMKVGNVFAAFRQELEAAGGRIIENSQVVGWSATDSAVEVRTADGTVFTGKYLIITAGAWAGKLLAELDVPLTVVRKPVIWYDVEDAALY
ncbi:FAD-dependent oxidoreductase, partial [Xanthobacter autotrophicus]|uniref:FAD-dependent oxidoreductase n=1 Tax=Xanthobacter autotrophicus TaxID=280 RepID=UPI0024AA22AB